MAWTSPHSWSTAELVTAALLNETRGNLNYLYAPPSCRVYNSADITIATATDTALTFNGERWDTNTMHSTSSNTGRITFTTAGTYLVGACIRFASNATGVRQAYIRLNGSTIIGDVRAQAITTGVPHTVNPSAVWQFAAADYVEVVVRQTSGGNLNVENGASYTPEFWAAWQAE